MSHARTDGRVSTEREPQGVSSEDLNPIYLIVSEQDFLLKQALDRLRARVGEVADLDFNLETFDGESASADAIVSACNTLPFASDRRLVIVNNVERLPKEGAETLVTYAADPSPTCVLALAAPKLAKNTRLYKAIDRIGGVLERKAPRGGEFVRSVVSLAADRDKRMSPDAAQTLVSATGEDLRRVSAELDKLVAFIGDGTEITRADVEQVVANAAKAKSWEFGEALADRDCRRALTLAAGILGEGDSVFALHATALRTIRELMTARALLDRGETSAVALAGTLGKQEWQVRKLPRQARAFESAELVDLLRDAAAGEAEMKTSRDARLVLERWIVKVCGV